MALTKIGTTGISNNLDVPGYLYLSGDEKELRFYEGVNYVAIKTNSSLAENYTLQLPLNDGGASEFLQTNGSGVLTWAGAVVSGVNTTITGLTGLATQNALELDPFNTSAGNTGEIRFKELAANGVHYAAIKAPDSIAANYTLILPVDDGTTGQALISNGSGVLSWSDDLTLTSLQVDNININGNTLSSTAGTDLFITPLAGQQLILDGTIIIDAGVVTAATSITSTEFVGGGVGLTALNGTQVTSGTLPAARIADDSIVEAKLDVSNDPTNDYFLQAQSGEGGGLTWAAAAGAITGLNTNAANRLITFGSTTTELDGEANLTFDGSMLSLASSNSGNANTFIVENTSDTSSASAKIRIKVAGSSSTGDAFIDFTEAGGGEDWSIGLDVSASEFKICKNADLQAGAVFVINANGQVSMGEATLGSWVSIASDGSREAQYYNVASITDTGAGDRTVVISTDHATAVYAISSNGPADGTIEATADTRTAGSYRVRVYSNDTTLTDQPSQHATFGAIVNI